jgi:hypothetical protein
MPVEAVVTGAFYLEGMLAGLTALVDAIGAAASSLMASTCCSAAFTTNDLEPQELLRLDSWIRKSKT